jgi:PIN domain nuclease of toxin-antitoxin system
MAIKASIGKLQLPASITELMESCKELEFCILPIAAAHLECLKDLPWIHRDPFDRLLVSQAAAEDLTIVTVDGNISKYDITHTSQPKL